MYEDIIYQIYDFIRQQGHKDIFEHERPIQRPFSMWIVDEIVYELRINYDLLPDEIFRKYISLMDEYEEYAEVERKTLYRTAKETAIVIYEYLFDVDMANKHLFE